MKRFFILTFMLCCCMLQVFAHQFTYTDENGVTWTLEVNTNTTAIITDASNYGSEVVIPGKISLSASTAELTVTEVRSIFRNNNTLVKVTLPQTPIVLYNTFEFCSNLKEVINSQYITKCTMGAFGATALKSIDLSNCEYVGGFDGCKKLETVTLKKCTTIEERAFANCSNLKSLGETSTVQNFGSEAFSGCTNLISLDLSSCTNLNKIYYTDLNTCSNLKEIILSKDVTEIPSMSFGGISNSVKFINLDFSKITSIGSYAFENCNSFTEIDLPVCTEIEDCAFNGCTFNKITLSDKITSIGKNAFGGTEKVFINATKVPSFGGELGKNTIIFVPKVSLELYKNGNTWKDYTGQIFAIDDTKTEYDVKTTALANAPGLLQQLDRDKLNNIISLKVSGTINGYDIMLFRNKMDNLHHLDLSDADIVANPYEYYQGCSTQDSILGNNAFSGLEKLISIKCPNSVKKIYGAFNGCTNLKSVILPNQLEFIGINGVWGTFNDCSSLTNVVFKNCKEIGANTFMDCNSLRSINLPEGITKIGAYAFNCCYALKEITIPNGVESIESWAFRGCKNLTNISFPPSLKTINEFAFYDCSSLDSISLPGLTRIEDRAFNGCKNLKELKVPSTLESIGEGAFGDCSLEKVYTYTVLPVNISQSTFSNFENISLYVPTQSVDNYYLNTQWSQFKEIHEFDEPYTYFYLDKEFTLEKRFDGTPDIDIKEDGGLKVDGKDNQEAGDITIKGDGNNGNSGTLITDGNLNAKMMRFDISVTANKWYFFSFPFDINMANVKAPGEYKWKRYDGKIRSDQGSGGWVDLASNEEWLKQGDGYIFQTNKEGILTLRVTKEKFGQLDATNIMKPLDAYPSGNIADASWNFIGNPQTSYFNVNDLGYDAPITVWNGNSYEAVRPGDDDYTLHPFQAFFVQKPAETSGIEFKAEDRLTKTGSQIRAQETKARRLARGVMPSRLIINLNVTDGTQTDKTRVVFNNQKSRDYEIDCDAAKFMTMGNAPQLYSVEGKGTQYAINERPMGSVQLGFTVKKSGTFTISAARMDQPMLLEDKQAGITFDLTNGDYEFTSGAGTFNSRFMLIPSRGTTGIADIVSKTGVSIMPTEDGLYINGTNGKSVQVFNLNGIEVANRSTDGMLNLATGVYIVKVNGMSTKVMVK